VGGVENTDLLEVNGIRSAQVGADPIHVAVEGDNSLRGSVVERASTTHCAEIKLCNKRKNTKKQSESYERRREETEMKEKGLQRYYLR
tara:strand:- start:1576 stop:1839 length:264 start_codon:yes stop_codon:yes gene_type:complete